MTLAIECHQWSLEIGRALVELPHDRPSSLELGNAGIGLFLAHLATATGDRRFDAAAAACLHVAAAAMPAMDPMLYSGALGVAWVVEHLGCAADINAATDAFVAELLERGDFRDRWELMHGLAGIGVYLLERPATPPRDELLGWLVSLLDAVGYTDRRGVHWRSTVPEEAHDLGMAHGACGIAVVLARILAETEVEHAAVTRLLEGTVRAIRACRLSDAGASIYPASRERRVASRLGWCHGDLAVAVAFAAAGDALGDPVYLREGRALARRAALRGVTSSRVVDAGLCHGTLGIALSFHHLHARFGGLELADAARRWLGRTVQLRARAKGLGGVRTWAAGTHQWVNEPGLVVGAAGVGLALLTIGGKADPAWQRALCLGPLRTPRRGLSV